MERDRGSWRIATTFEEEVQGWSSLIQVLPSRAFAQGRSRDSGAALSCSVIERS